MQTPTKNISFQNIYGICSQWDLELHDIRGQHCNKEHTAMESGKICLRKGEVSLLWG